jgi:hypothetical protein
MERIPLQSTINEELASIGYSKERENQQLNYSWMKYALYFILSIISLSSFAQNNQNNKWQVDEIFRLEIDVEKTNDEILITKDKIQNCDVIISKSEKIIGLAQQSGNTIADGIAKNALQKAMGAKEKNISKLIIISEYLNKLKAVLDYLKTNPKDAELRLEKFKFESKNDEWMKAKDEDILKRLEANSPYCENLYKSLKTNAPPPLTKSFANLQTGDVILIDRGSKSETELLNVTDKLSSYTINALDQLASTTTMSKASHALIYLKEINGKKMFLDNVPGHGPCIISEQEYLYLYGNREANVARLAQPLKKEQYQKVYEAARNLADDQSKMNNEQLKNGSLIKGSKFGIAGSDMVCSESSRWVLIEAGVKIADTEDKLKRKVGIEFSPTDFCKSDYFIVTPLTDVPKAKAYTN